MLAIVLSVVSLVLASIAIFWNIYKEILLRPFTDITGMISNIHHGGKILGPYINLTILNKGPGDLIINSIVVKRSSLIRKILHKEIFASIINDYTNPYNPKMPMKIELHNTATQLLTFDNDCFFKEDNTHIGYIDTLKRYHWMKKKHFNEMKKEFNKTFGQYSVI